MRLESVSLTQLNGWPGEDHAAALAAFQRSAREMLATGHGFKREAKFGASRSDWLPTLERSLNATDGKSFFEENFLAFRVHDAERPQGLFTGYYEPEADGARAFSPEYPCPIYRRPADLVGFDGAEEIASGGFKYGRKVNGQAQPYLTREEIEKGGLAGKGLEIAWLKSWEDAFFIHIQGSGRIRLGDGSAIRLAYALKTGHPYTGIGGVLIERGVLTHENNSMQSIRAWMKQNPSEARSLMWLNKSFIFFREVNVEDPNLGALGAEQVSLTPRRSLAIDRAYWMFGMPIWLDTTLPAEAGGHKFQQMVVAQDTGSAIKGAARGDVYWGWGDEAALIAGHMKSPGAFTALLPHKVAAALGLM